MRLLSSLLLLTLLVTGSVASILVVNYHYKIIL